MVVDSEAVKRVSSFKFLGLHTTNDLPPATHTATVIREAQQCLLQEAAASQTAAEHPHKLHSDILRHSVVCQLWQDRLEVTAEGHQDGTKDHWDTTTNI